MAGGSPVLLRQRLEDGFVIDADLLAAQLTPRTRVVLLSSPTNPTGAVYDEASLKRVAEVLRPAVQKNPDLMIVTDDLYRRLVYAPTRFCSILHVAPDLAKNVILVDGVSKTYAMTGWRIGFVAAPRPLIEAMDGLQGQVTTNAAAVSQHAALAAITGDQAPVLAMIDEFDRRRKVMSAALKAMPGVTLCEPRGAFYCFADFSSYLQPHGRLANDLALLDYLMSEAGVAAIPGSGFFAPGFLRFSYATSLELIEEGMSRLARGLDRLRGG
jgi:aspartate aminotransferase